MVIITGVSRGLGKAIAEKFLAKGDYVHGIGRSTDLEHPCFTFSKCDLSNLDEIRELKFDVLSGPVTLINNAGIIGEIKQMSKQQPLNIDEVFTVNVSAPAIITNHVYQQCLDKGRFTLVNISSGAARRAIPSWASYCASKAALNMLSETFFLEERELGNDIKVFAVSPGVMDTGMQEQIRATRVEDFSTVEVFRHRKETDDMLSPSEAADRVMVLLDRDYNEQVLVSLADIAAE